ncbi:uncharacterized protein V1516DRAFT_687725 [Lipomyces oligophaga]|uniref:uncharacterized protein n=1 Tax=Lipomyces oligophaga TaxID=45792 RepID=UPI0034CE0FFB
MAQSGTQLWLAGLFGLLAGGLVGVNEKLAGAVGTRPKNRYEVLKTLAGKLRMSYDGVDPASLLATFSEEQSEAGLFTVCSAPSSHARTSYRPAAEHSKIELCTVGQSRTE